MAKRKVYLGPLDAPQQQALLVEGVADSAITPGELVVRTATGLDVSANASTVFGQELLFAIEAGSAQGKEINDDYAIGEYAYSVQLRSGEFANVRVATAQTLDKGTPLASNGDGTLKVAVTTGADQVLAYSDEALTTSGVTLVKVRAA